MRLPAAALLIASLIAAAGCRSVDSDRLPPMPVRIVFTTVGEWHTYGIAGATDTREFILESRQPAGFPYSAGMATGFGGVLLTGQYTYGGNPVADPPVAFDLACPVEARREVRIHADHEAGVAECPKCGSTYDIYSGTGAPLSGPAAQHGYGLTRYRVTATAAANRYATITN